MNVKNKSVLVTGGAGFVGSHLVDELLNCGNRVIVVDDFSLGKRENLPEENESLVIYEGDVSNYYFINSILDTEEIDVVFNLATISLPVSLINPFLTFSVNVKMTRNLCELLRKGRYNRLIQFSSSEAYGSAVHVPMDEKHPLNATTPYAASKASSDLLVLSYCRTFDVNAVILRPFNIYGPKQNAGQYAGITPKVITNILNNRKIIITGDGKQSRDFTYVSDVVNAVILLQKKNNLRGIVINVGNGINYSMNDWVNSILTLCKKDVPVVYDSQRRADVMCHKADIQLAQQLIRYKPTVCVKDGLFKTIEWYSSKKYEF